jgi:branched-chain amino acid transport system ATP-binding protein
VTAEAYKTQKPLLEVRGLTMKFGSLAANEDIGFDVFPGDIVGLIGPNGAGKTTCFNCVTGFLHPTAGSVRFSGTDITGWAPYDIARLGLVRTFQIVHTFRDMTVLENVVTSAFLRAGNSKDALATAPRLIMLDETMAGLNQTEIREAMDLCLRLKKDGLTLVVVEHIMEALMPISDRVVVLDSGRKIMEGTPEEVASDERVIKAYLGDTYNVAG